MKADIVRLAYHKVDIKIIVEDRMHLLQWRRRFWRDQVLLDGKVQQTSEGLFGRETIYGLVFGRDDDGNGGERVMFTIDARQNTNDPAYWTDGEAGPRGVRLDTAAGPVLAHGSLDERNYEKPADFNQWIRKNLGIQW